MKADLWVLQHRSAAAPRLHRQRVSYPDPPVELARFVCETSEGQRFKTDQVVTVQPLGPTATYFATRHSAYLLEHELEDASPC